MGSLDLIHAYICYLDFAGIMRKCFNAHSLYTSIRSLSFKLFILISSLTGFSFQETVEARQAREHGRALGILVVNADLPAWQGTLVSWVLDDLLDGQLYGRHDHLPVVVVGLVVRHYDSHVQHLVPEKRFGIFEKRSQNKKNIDDEVRFVQRKNISSF